MTQFINALVCDECWTREHGDQQPLRVRQDFEGTCFICRKPTRSNIYKRVEIPEDDE